MQRKRLADVVRGRGTQVYLLEMVAGTRPRPQQRCTSNGEPLKDASEFCYSHGMP
jgi:hypothetical protein